MKHELQNIISGKSQVRYGDAIETVSNYLRRSKSSSAQIERGIYSKKKEENLVELFTLKYTVSRLKVWNFCQHLYFCQKKQYICPRNEKHIPTYQRVI